MPGLTREIQLIDETDIIKSRLKEQTSGGKGKPWFERKREADVWNQWSLDSEICNNRSNGRYTCTVRRIV